MCRMRLCAAHLEFLRSATFGSTEGTYQRRQSYKFVASGARAEEVRRGCGVGAV